MREPNTPAASRSASRRRSVVPVREASIASRRQSIDGAAASRMVKVSTSHPWMGVHDGQDRVCPRVEHLVGRAQHAHRRSLGVESLARVPQRLVDVGRTLVPQAPVKVEGVERRILPMSWRAAGASSTPARLARAPRPSIPCERGGRRHDARRRAAREGPRRPSVARRRPGGSGGPPRRPSARSMGSRRRRIATRPRAGVRCAPATPVPSPARRCSARSRICGTRGGGDGRPRISGSRLRYSGSSSRSPCVRHHASIVLAPPPDLSARAASRSR